MNLLKNMSIFIICFSPIFLISVKQNNANGTGSKKILVTGGAGFLGGNLCHKLIELGHQVTALDNLSTGRIENILDLKQNKNFKFIKHDIINPINLELIGFLI